MTYREDGETDDNNLYRADPRRLSSAVLRFVHGGAPGAAILFVYAIRPEGRSLFWRFADDLAAETDGALTPLWLTHQGGNRNLAALFSFGFQVRQRGHSAWCNGRSRLIKVLMVFWVYENWIAESKAVIHGADCAFCNNGAGAGRNTRGAKNGKWHGPFPSLDDAETAALQTRRPVRRHSCVARNSITPQIEHGRDPRPKLDTAEVQPANTSQLEEFGFARA